MEKFDSKLAGCDILYVNYEPYNNAGCILDYLKEGCPDLWHLSLIYHRMNDENRNSLEYIEKGVLRYKKNYFTPKIPRRLEHIFVFFLSLIHLFHLKRAVLRFVIKKKKKVPVFLSVNAFPVMAAIILKKFGLIDKVIYWVWDYYPVKSKGLYKKLFFHIYWRLDKYCTKNSDFVWYLNERLLELREKQGIVKKEKIVQGLGIRQIKNRVTNPEKRIGFFGVLKKGFGLDLVINSFDLISAGIPGLRLDIIGSGPDEGYFKNKANERENKSNITFYGFIKEEKDISEIISGWTAGCAPYIPDESSVAYYTDPSKIKFYLSCGIPVITTSIPPIAKEIERAQAGIIIEYRPEALAEAVSRLSDKPEYRTNACLLAEKFDYRTIYNKVFSEML